MDGGPILEWVASSEFGDTLVAVGEISSSTRPIFTQRRIFNPRYRPPTTGGPAILPAARSRLRALDRFRAQVFHQSPSTPSLTQWELAAGELYREDDELEVTAAGSMRASEPRLHALRLSGRHRALEGSLMDAEPVTLGRAIVLGRLRGAVLRYAAPREARWLALAGVPTPIPDQPIRRMALGGAAVENLRFEEARLSASGFAFWRGVDPTGTARGDTLPGRGAMGNFGWSLPIARGALGGRLGAQIHGLDGHRSLAAQHALEWSYHSPALSASLSDERGTRRARALGTDRIADAPGREDRWNLQQRFARGRAEAHATGVLRDGGDPVLAARTAQIGASGSIARSSWYGGGDAGWDRRALTGHAERRLSVYAGGLVARGHAVLARLERLDRASDPGVLTAMAEASVALPRGARLGLEPRFAWEGGGFRQGDLSARFSWPLAWASSSITASLTAGSARDERFRGRLREAGLSFVFRPRPREQGDLEVRRFDQDGRPLLEYRMAYETEVARYDVPGQGWFAGRDTGRILVRVVRSGNGSGMPDILISLDGKELRFTDTEGLARFDDVAPGVHVVAIEERSLPAQHEVAYATRVFVTVEPGRVPEPVSFAIARSERRVRF